MLHQLNSAGLLGSIFFCVVSGMVLFLYGERLPRRGDWFAGTALSVVLLAVVLTWTGVESWQFALPDVLTGWIWPRESPSSLTIGTLIDSTGFVFILLSVLVGTAVLVRSQTPMIAGGVVISVAAVALAWISLTPWLALAALGLATFAGLAAFGENWGDSGESRLAGTWFSERILGILISVLGGLVLSASGARMAWPIDYEIQQSWADATLLGTTLFLLGLALQFHPFPFLGWLGSSSRQKELPRLALAQIQPILIAFALFYRIHPAILGSHLLQVAGSVSLALAFLVLLSGCFQASWSKALNFWTAAGGLLSVAGLALGSLWVGTALAAGTVLASTLYGLLGSAAESEQKGRPPGWQEYAGRFFLLAAGAAGAGFIGFLSAGGRLLWFTEIFDRTLLLAFVSFVLFAFAFLCWKILWLLIKSPDRPPMSFWAMAVATLLFLFSLGLFWTGSLSGGAVPFGWDNVFVTAFTDMPEAVYSTHAEYVFVRASWLHWGLLLVALFSAYWMSGRGRDLLGEVGVRNRFGAFLAQGYALDRAFEVLSSSVSTVSERTVWLIDQNVWGRVIPRVLFEFAARLSASANRLNRTLNGGIEYAVRTFVVVPGKIIQLVQSGDVRWYAIFAIGSVVAILINFLRIISQ